MQGGFGADAAVVTIWLDSRGNDGGAEDGDDGANIVVDDP